MSSEDPPKYTQAPEGKDTQAQAAPPAYQQQSSQAASSSTRAPMSEDERFAMLQAFAEEKEKANDNFGGQKGSAGQYTPNDPTRPFRKLSQALRGGVKKGEEKIEWSGQREADEGDRGWTSDGYKHEVSKGDYESHWIV
ncbi:MAG: hypothetical protein INR71_08490 [Terriglobus roseus]|nr:hypothetical protein [Terriglobus roseus]